MAVDTVGIRSPYLSEEIAARFERVSVLREGTDLQTGDKLYCITTGHLSGSYDSRISFRVEREEWQQSKAGGTFKAPSPPFVYIEASVHKATLGHNVYGGPESFQPAVRWLIALVEELLGIELPMADAWMVDRVDWAEVYQLPSYEACEEWFRGLNAADYPRRKVHRYGLSGLYAAGRTTAVKFYHKGPEFHKHDRSRLKNALAAEEFLDLQLLANTLIRAEVELHTRKLQYDFGHRPLVAEITDEYLKRVHDQEVTRLLKDGAKEMETVRQALEVEKRLYSVYDARLAGVLLGTWYRLAAFGEDYIKKNKSIPRPTFYRHRKLLVDAGITWLGSDVVLKKSSLIPAGFVPVRSDSRRLQGQHPTVTQKLAAYIA